MNKFVQKAPYVGSKLKPLSTIYYYSPPLKSYEHLLIPFAGGEVYEINHPFTQWNLEHLESLYPEFMAFSYFANHPNFEHEQAMNNRLLVSANDLDKDLVAISFVMLMYPEKFLASAELHLKSQALFEYLKTYSPKDIWEQAMKKMYMIATSFSALQQSWAYVVDSKRDRRITYDKDRLTYMIDRLKHIFFFSEDYEHFLNRFIKRSTIPIFVYSDPPYVVTKDTDYYTLNFKDWEDHTRHKKAMDKINDKGHKFLVSYDNVEEIKELYKDYNVFETNLRYTMSGYGRHNKNKELLISNYTDFAKEEYIDQINKKINVFGKTKRNGKAML